MEIWWSSLDTFEQIIAIIAATSTVILIIQTVMSLFSFFDLGGDDIDAGSNLGDNSDNDSITENGLKIFTHRGVVAFFSIFGWSALIFLRSDVSLFVSMLVAFLLGTVTMFIVAFLFRLMMKLQTDGNVDINTAIGKIGTVYIPIPPARNGTGKINAIISGRHIEYDAITDENETLKTGEQIVIVGVNEQNNFIVIRQ